MKTDGGGIKLSTNYLTEREAIDLLMNTINNPTSDAIGALDEKLSEVYALRDKRIAEIRASESEWKAGDGGVVYYISNGGDDKNDGKSEKTAIKTFARLAELKLNPGDVVLLERGSLWREQLQTVSGVTYSAYGKGEKPTIYGSPENGASPEKWIKVDGIEHLWCFYTDIRDVGVIVFNEGEIYADKVLRLWDGEKYVDAKTKVEFELSELDANYKFFSFADSKLTKTNMGLSDSVGKLYLYFDKGNPGEYFDSIEFATHSNAVRLKGDGTVIDNLRVKFTGSHGIGGGTVGNVTVRNCEIGQIGGARHRNEPDISYVSRYGNGVEIYGSCDSFTIENCYVYDCYDAGVTHQYSKGGRNDVHEDNVSYINNVISGCAYNIEYFVGVGDDDTVKRTMSNILFKGNLLLDSGTTFGARAHSVDIMGWNHRNEATNFVIEDNIFAGALNRAIYIGATEADWLPIFRNNTYVMKIGGKYALYGLSGEMTESAYDHNLESNIADITGEIGGKFYFYEAK